MVQFCLKLFEGLDSPVDYTYTNLSNLFSNVIGIFIQENIFHQLHLKNC